MSEKGEAPSGLQAGKSELDIEAWKKEIAEAGAEERSAEAAERGVPATSPPPKTTPPKETVAPPAAPPAGLPAPSGVEETSATEDDQTKVDPKEKEWVPETARLEAEEYGFNQEDFDAMGVDGVQRAIAKLKFITAKAAGQQGVVPKAETKDPAPAAVEFSLDGEEFEELDPNIKTGLEQRIAAALTATREEHDKQIAQLRADTAASQGQNRTETLQEARVSDFDTRIERLGASYENVLGKGGSDEVQSADTNAFAIRKDIYTRMEVQRASNSAQGRFETDEQLFNGALYASLGPRVSEIERAKLTNEIETRQGQFLSPVTSRVDTDPVDKSKMTPNEREEFEISRIESRYEASRKGRTRERAGRRTR